MLQYLQQIVWRNRKKLRFPAWKKLFAEKVYIGKQSLNLTKKINKVKEVIFYHCIRLRLNVSTNVGISSLKKNIGFISLLIQLRISKFSFPFSLILACFTTIVLSLIWSWKVCDIRKYIIFGLHLYFVVFTIIALKLIQFKFRAWRGNTKVCDISLQLKIWP